MGFHATDKDVPAWKDLPRTLEEQLAAICEHELLTPVTHNFLVSVLGVLTEARQALEPFAKMASNYDKTPKGTPSLDQPTPDEFDIQERSIYRVLANRGNQRLRLGDLRNARAVLAKFSASPVLTINTDPPASAPPQP